MVVIEIVKSAKIVIKTKKKPKTYVIGIKVEGRMKAKTTKNSYQTKWKNKKQF